MLTRPTREDEHDPERMTQTHLEQVNANREFRPIVDFLRSIRYRHLVPHLIRDPERGGDRIEDPCGADFLVRIAETPEKTRVRRLRRINQALRVAVPQLRPRQGRGRRPETGRGRHGGTSGGFRSEPSRVGCSPTARASRGSSPFHGTTCPTTRMIWPIPNRLWSISAGARESRRSARRWRPAQVAGGASVLSTAAGSLLLPQGPRTPREPPLTPSVLGERSRRCER